MTRRFARLPFGVAVLLAVALCNVYFLTSPTAAQQDAPAKKELKGDPWPLETGAVSGEKLDPEAEPIMGIYDGREVRFDCPGCKKRFEKNPARYLAEADKEIIKRQRPYYALDVCPLMDEPMIVNGKDTAKSVVYRNRLIRLCCGKCVRRFERNPDNVLRALDKAIKEKQGKHYPLTTCLVMPDVELKEDHMLEIIVCNRLIRVGSEGCAAKVRANPAMYLKRLDDAWKKSGRKPVES